MRIAITGATGFLGRHLLPRLAAAGHELVAWHRPGRPPPADLPERVQWVEGSLGPDMAAEPLLAGADAVVHAALAYARPGAGLGAYLAENVAAGGALMETARGAGVARFVLVSSLPVHDLLVAPGARIGEDTALVPISDYAAAKIALDALAVFLGRRHGWPIAALRPTLMHGLEREPSRSRWYGLVRRVRAGGDIDTSHRVPGLDVADVCSAIEHLLEAPESAIAGRIFHASGPDWSDREVAELAAELRAAEPRSETWRAPTIADRRAAEIPIVDTAPLGALGWAPSGREALAAYVSRLSSAISAATSVPPPSPRSA